MIICICKNVSSNTVREYKDQGKSLKDLVQDHEVCTGCKKCLSYFKEEFKK